MWCHEYSACDVINTKDWCHIHCILCHTQCVYENTATISGIAPTISDITWTVSLSSHPLYKWHHTTLFMTSHPCIWYHFHWLWHHIYYTCDSHCSCDITPTMFITSYPLYRTPHTLCMKAQLYLPSHPLYLISHPLYLCHHTHCIDDITPTICMTTYALYMISYSFSMNSHHCICDIMRESIPRQIGKNSKGPQGEPRRERSGILKEEERTDFFFPLFPSTFLRII